MGRAAEINHRIIFDQDQHWYIQDAVSAFMTDRQSGGVSPGTIQFYRVKLKLWLDYCTSQVVERLDQLSPEIIRGFLLFLKQTHNPGGVDACYRALSAFLRWWEAEYEESGWRNPIKKVKRPKVPKKYLAPARIDVIKAMLETCGRDYYGLRDRAIILTLCDTGCRASELLDLNIDDLNWMTGEIIIHKGKGAKFRKVCLGARCRRAIRAYLKERQDYSEAALFVTHNGKRLTRMGGLRVLLKKRAELAGVTPPSPHAFRRYFARSQLNAGLDIYSLKELMGHEDLQMLLRYLKDEEGESSIRLAQARGSPADREHL